jgi:hypothetical protein
MTTRGSLVLSPELVEGPVLSLSKDRRIASLYQDKENKMLNDGSPIKTFEDDGSVNFEKIYFFMDSVLELRDIYSNCSCG